jgi:hypothetical protein
MKAANPIACLMIFMSTMNVPAQEPVPHHTIRIDIKRRDKHKTKEIRQ